MKQFSNMESTIKFIGKDGESHVFNTETNKWNRKQMYWFDTGSSMYAADKKRVKSIIKDLTENYKGVKV